MFLVNSRLGLFTADQLLDHSFSRSYGVILPSSLTVVLSLTLGYSPCPPVSVLGTGTYIIILATFLGSLASTDFVIITENFAHTSAYTTYGFANMYTFVLRPESNNRLYLAFFVTTSVI